MAKHLDSNDWEIRAETIEMFARLSELSTSLKHFNQCNLLAYNFY